MISNDTIKSAAHSIYATDSELTDQQKTAIEILAYEYALSVKKGSAQSSDDPVSILSSYGSQFKSKFLALKGKYVAYELMLSTIEKIGANNILSLTDQQISELYGYYLSNQYVEEFSDTHFSDVMYGVSGISDREHAYLLGVHYSVFCPIARYYHDLYGTNIRDMEIVKCDYVPGNVGKKVTFYLGNFDSGRIYSDIVSKRVPVPYRKIELEYPYVTIVNI